jgi:hypothetical protein
MHKVIVEEPRHGGGPNKQHRRANLPDELQPKCQGMRRPYSDTHRKWFGEHLGPLKRWLRSQVGHHWNDVYSDACTVIKPDNVVRAHLRTHMLAYVERNTFMKEGGVWCYRHWGQEREVPIAKVRSRCCLFYVHPETGVLCEIPPHRRTKRVQTVTKDLVRLSKTRVLRKLNGLWFDCSVERFPTRFKKEDSPWRWDYAEGKMINHGHTHDLYNATDYCVAKRQLSHRELKKHGLKNDPARSGAFAARSCRVTNTPYSYFRAGRRSWVLVNPAVAVQFRSEEHSEVV